VTHPLFAEGLALPVLAVALTPLHLVGERDTIALKRIHHHREEGNEPGTTALKTATVVVVVQVVLMLPHLEDVLDMIAPTMTPHHHEERKQQQHSSTRTEAIAMLRPLDDLEEKEVVMLMMTTIK
jgi:hypothetical protein